MEKFFITSFFLESYRLAKKKRDLKKNNIPTEIRIMEVDKPNFKLSSIDSNKMRLNLLVPSLDKKHVFGGISTALDIFSTLVSQWNCDARIIVTDHPYDKKGSVNLEGFIYDQSDVYHEKQIVSVAEKTEDDIYIGKNDIFMATAWWTAYIIESIIYWQSNQYKTDQVPFIYLIQDYEPGFYSWSSHYLMADSTYKSEIPKIAIFNSKELMDFMQSKSNNFKKQFYFEPKLNKTLLTYLKTNKDNIRKEKKVVLYGRPTVARNAFTLVVMALRLWSKTQPDIEDWEIISMGEDHDDILLENNAVIKSTGKMSLEKYAETLSTAYMGISLMVSPHPSYPPLEMSTFGIKTITNTFENKDLSSFNDNIISLTVCNDSTIANALSQLANKFSTSCKIDLNSEYANPADQFLDLTYEIHDEFMNTLM